MVGNGETGEEGKMDEQVRAKLKKKKILNVDLKGLGFV